MKLEIFKETFPIWKEGRKEGRKEMFHLTSHSTHFSYGYIASDIW